jgi:integrase
LRFLQGRIAAGKNAPKSLDYYRGQLRKWADEIGHDKALESIRAFHLIGGGDATPHRIQAVRRLFGWAEKAGIVEANPFADVEQPAFGRRKRVLQREEAARLLLGADRAHHRLGRQRETIGVCNACASRKPDVLAVVMRLPGCNAFGGDRELCRDCRKSQKGHWRYSSKPSRRWKASARRPLRWLLVALCRTIARPGELRRVRWRDYDPLARTFTLTKFKGKGLRSDQLEKRVILVDERIVRLLERWRRRRQPKPEDHIFLNRYGRPWTTNSLCRAVRHARKLAGLGADENGEKVVAYTWRHTSATRALRPLNSEVPAASLYEVSVQMGHATTRTTQRYAHNDVGRAETLAAATAAPKRKLSK